MYIERKKIGKEIYNYLKISVRYKDKIRTRTIAYLGKEKLKKQELKNIFLRYNPKAEEMKKKTIEELKMILEEQSKLFLDNEQLSELEKIKKEFNQKLNELDDKTKQDMFNDFLTLYVYNTNAIEGNTFTLRDTDLLLNKGITPQGKSLREVNDHLNAKETFLFILAEKPKINHETIIKLHSLLMKNMDDRIGSYRLHNVRVFGATFESSPAEYVKADMNLLLRWYQKNKIRLHPLILAAAFHHKFERIHPFYDGNGRTGRMLLNLMLFKSNIVPIVLSNKQRKKYYESLSSADKTGLLEITGDFKPLVKFISTQILKTWNTIFKQWG